MMYPRINLYQYDEKIHILDKIGFRTIIKRNSFFLKKKKSIKFLFREYRNIECISINIIYVFIKEFNNHRDIHNNILKTL